MKKRINKFKNIKPDKNTEAGLLLTLETNVPFSISWVIYVMEKTFKLENPDTLIPDLTNKFTSLYLVNEKGSM